jgi:hypothetical protein
MEKMARISVDLVVGSKSGFQPVQFGPGQEIKLDLCSVEELGGA